MTQEVRVYIVYGRLTCVLCVGRSLFVLCSTSTMLSCLGRHHRRPPAARGTLSGVGRACRDDRVDR